MQKQQHTVSTNFHHEAVSNAFRLETALKPEFKKVPEITLSCKVDIPRSNVTEKEKKNAGSRSPKHGKRKESLNENLSTQKPLLILQ